MDLRLTSQRFMLPSPQDLLALGLQAEPCPGGVPPAGCRCRQAAPHGPRRAGCRAHVEGRHPQDAGRYLHLSTVVLSSFSKG